jgi:hypothetical protein
MDTLKCSISPHPMRKVKKRKSPDPNLNQGLQANLEDLSLGTD